MSPPPPPPPPPSPGLLGLAVLFGRIAFTAFSRAVSYPLRKDRASALGRDVFLAVVRTIVLHVTIPQSRYLTPPTTERYLSFCKKQRVDPKTLQVDVGDGKSPVKAHWIGNPDARAVVLYLHGGGYTQPATEGYCLYFTRLVKDLNPPGETNHVAVLMLAYQLAPEAKYPTQLQETAAVLSHLLRETGRSPPDIFITGDSAGGGLCLSLLSHILHPHPHVPRLELSAPLGGALVYSPWVSFHTDKDSFTRNAQRDMLHPVMLRRWAAMYLGQSDPRNPEADPGSVAGDSYSEPATNPPSWWSGLDRAVSGILIWAGGDEVFVDDVRDFARYLREGWARGGGQGERVCYVEAPCEPHIAPIMEVMTAPHVKSESQQAIEAWYRARLARE